MRKPQTGEVLYVRLPPGTKERIAAVRGLERESDWARRLVLMSLERVEKVHADLAAAKAKGKKT